MACSLCRLEIPETLCKTCAYLIEQGNGPELPPSCEQCGAPLASPAEENDLCYVCSALLEVVTGSEWFICAHEEWDQENVRLANLKRELLQG